jgi:hypothetical protein
MNTGTTNQVLQRRLHELLLLQETAKKVKSLQRPDVSAQSVLTDVQEFASGGTLSDDATAIVLRRE